MLIKLCAIAYSAAVEPGQHWFVVLKTGKGTYELFDSLGSSIVYVKNHLLLVGHYFLNTTALQLDVSASCGQFCIYYIIHRLHNLDLSFDEFLNDFFCDIPSINELRVHDFLQQYGPQ